MTAPNPSRVEARKTGAKRYHGGLCAKHPEMLGERNAKNGNCIGCAKEKMRARRASDPDYYRRVTRVAWKKWYPKNKHKTQAYHRFMRSGITPEIFDKLLAIQDYKCAICQRAVGKSAHGDHCHDTKKPRGILCGSCNRAEGIIKRSGLDAAEFGRRLTQYLADSPAKKLGEH